MLPDVLTVVDFAKVAPESVERLASFLGDPRVDPLGQSIPPAERQAPWPGAPITRLDGARVGVGYEVTAIRTTGAAAEFLAASGLAPGSHLTVLASSDSGVLIETRGGVVNLDHRVAAVIDAVVTSG